MEQFANSAIPDRRAGSNRWLSSAQQGAARLHDRSDRYGAAAKLTFQISVARALNRAYPFATILEACHAPR
jgi:hypothetical protein